MKEFIVFFGWVTAISFSIAILNFFVKYINIKYINKLGKDKKKFAEQYRKFMKLIVRNHKLAGIIAIVAMLAHFFVALSSNNISLTGLLAAFFLISVFISGLYGTIKVKKNKGMWLKIHRVMALGLAATFLLHLL